MVMFHFSGTGNSKYIAELFCRNMNAGCYSVEDNIDFAQLINDEEIIGICYPVYGSRVPKIMRDFANRYAGSLKDKKLILLCTQMLFSGDGARAFTYIFPREYRRSLNVIYAEHFLMPNNVCNVFLTPLYSEEKISKCLENARRKMEIVCDEIKNGIVRKRGFNLASRALGMIQGVFFPGIEKRAAGKVWINDKCSKCRICVSCCPVGNFEYSNQSINTKNNCMICYRCINKCPEKAISVFLRGQVKKQYGGV